MPQGCCGSVEFTGGAASLATIELGIDEADEIFVRECRKGERGLNRRPRRRGGKARKRGLSREQVPVLSCTLPALDANSVKQALAPVIASDALLVSDAGHCHRPAGERVRGAVHIQTATSRHSQFKGFLRPFCGVATKYLDSCLQWFHLVALGKRPASGQAYESRIEPCNLNIIVS